MVTPMRCSAATRHAGDPEGYVDLWLEDVTRDEYGVYVQRIGAMAYRRWGGAPCVYAHLDNIELPANRGTLDESLHLTAEQVVSLASALLGAARAVIES
jgi:hypothetical protein